MMKTANMLKTLQLIYPLENLEALTREAAQRAWSHQAYLDRLLEGECQRREINGIARRIKNARFPVPKALEGFDWNWPKKINRPQVQNLLRLAFLEEHVNAIFEGMHRLQQMTGIRGFQARGYLYGHGPTEEERTGSRMADYWYQGAGEYKDLRWRGSPSHHNYSDAIHAYGVYYRLAAEGEQKNRCRQAIDDLVSIWADTDELLLPTMPPQAPQETILGLTDGRTPNLRVIMAAAGLKVAHYATGKEKFAKKYGQKKD